MSEQDNQEIEFKLDLKNRINYDTLVSLTAPEDQPIRQVNSFFDTERFDLKDHALVLRLRREPEKAYFTLKGNKSRQQEGLTVREEIEAPLDNDTAEHFEAVGVSIDDIPEPINNRLAPIIKDRRMSRKIGFANHRITTPYRDDSIDMTLEIDRSEFPDGSIDYELEVEIESSEEYRTTREAIEKLLAECSIPLAFQEKSKFQRAVERSQKDLGKGKT